MPIRQLLSNYQQTDEFLSKVKILKTGQSVKFSGLVGASGALVLAALRKEFKQIWLVTASSAKAVDWQSEIELFSQTPVEIFPALDRLPSLELVGQRLSLLSRLQQHEPTLIVSSLKAWQGQTSRQLDQLELKINQQIDREKLIDHLVSHGYRRQEIVGERGELAVRGGIIDIWPVNAAQPIRLELAGDRLESLRCFEAYSQRSVAPLPAATILPAEENDQVPLVKRLPQNLLVAVDEPLEFEGNFTIVRLSAFSEPNEPETFCAPLNYLNKLTEISSQALVISRHAARLQSELEAATIAGQLRGGFVFQDQEILGDRELFGEAAAPRRPKTAPSEGVADELLADLSSGDLVVHESYGIGRYQGQQTLAWEGVRQEYLLIEFADGDKVYVPPSLAGLVEKYRGAGEGSPRLSRLGSKHWRQTKGQVKQALQEMTRELTELYAARQKLPGYAFPPDDLWQKELAGTFPYEETADQSRAITETKQDMESERPMDRLICGDVGFGKTEVAIRAAAKAAAAGKQTAILVPTTILAEQHYNNFKTRLAATPFVVEMLSRFKSKTEQGQIVKALSGGGVDVVIGTHRLLSRDIKFKELGLVIIDEEHRFGVAHKEKLKKLKTTVDVLTLTATPIPRTLYFSLSGVRDLSLINTPPVDRSPIHTYILPWNEAVMKEALLRELDRGGQVYFLHNYVETIEGTAARLRKLLPGVKLAVAHGQLPEKRLEKVMLEFMQRQYDLLVCTSIIESGIDIPNVNTIFIDQADHLGLAQLYQIRGRVGRSAVRAYAYLFYHPARSLSDQALARLKAIQELTALGSGYKLAMRDLEIRGAGNLLGAEQSGHIYEVGFDLYCELLEEAVKEVKGIKAVSPREVEIDLKVEAFIPADYIADDRQRLATYRRLNLLGSETGVQELKQELRDRFGSLPASLERLFAIVHLKLRAIKAGVKSLKEVEGKIQIEWLSGKRATISSARCEVLLNKFLVADDH